MAAPSKTPEALSSDKALTAILALLVAQREDAIAANGEAAPRKTEVILAASGLTLAEIAPLVGKHYEAVKATVRRGKAK